MNRRSNAFSLIELLVVISIISLLIGILLPALSAARDRAQHAACQQHLRQIGIALHSYAADANDHLAAGPGPVPPYFPGPETPTSQIQAAPLSDDDGPIRVGIGLLWDHAYLASPELFLCPTEEGVPPETVDNLQTYGDHENEALGSYVYRQLGETSGARISNLGLNSEGDAARSLALEGTVDVSGVTAIQHDRRAVNIVFADGHVRQTENHPDDGPYIVDRENWQDLVPELFITADRLAR